MFRLDIGEMSQMFRVYTLKYWAVMGQNKSTLQGGALIFKLQLGAYIPRSVRLSVRPTQKLEKSQRNLYWGQAGAR